MQKTDVFIQVKTRTLLNLHCQIHPVLCISQTNPCWAAPVSAWGLPICNIATPNVRYIVTEARYNRIALARVLLRVHLTPFCRGIPSSTLRPVKVLVSLGRLVTSKHDVVAELPWIQRNSRVVKSRVALRRCAVCLPPKRKQHRLSSVHWMPSTPWISRIGSF